MKINKLIKVGERTIENTIMVDDYNDDGEVIGQHEEVVTKIVPIMEARTVDMTPEEEAEALAAQREAEEREANREPTAEERIQAQVMYTALMTDTLLMEGE